MSHNKNTLHFDQEQTPAQSVERTWHKVGHSALAYFGEVPQVKQPKTSTQPEDFGHLFPATRIPAELLHNEAKTPEGAERLIDKLDIDDPYRDYALSELSLYHMNHHDIVKAYSMLHDIKDGGVATHVLSQIVMFEEDNSIDIVPVAKLAPELHDLAIHAYDNAPVAENARALVQASEALPDDKELRLFARIAMGRTPRDTPADRTK